MRHSAAATIQEYLEKAVDRLELDDLDQDDFEKVLDHIKKAREEIEKELDE